MVGGSPQLSIQGTKAPTIDPLFLHLLCCFLGSFSIIKSGNNAARAFKSIFLRMSTATASRGRQWRAGRPTVTTQRQFSSFKSHSLQRETSGHEPCCASRGQCWFVHVGSISLSSVTVSCDSLPVCSTPSFIHSLPCFSNFFVYVYAYACVYIYVYVYVYVYVCVNVYVCVTVYVYHDPFLMGAAISWCPQRSRQVRACAIHPWGGRTYGGTMGGPTAYFRLSYPYCVVLNPMNPLF